MGPNQDEFLSFWFNDLFPLPPLDHCRVIVGVVFFFTFYMVADGRNDFCLSWLLFFFGSRCRQPLASATPICHLWEWGGLGIFGMWNLGTGNIETFTHQRWDENKNPLGGQQLVIGQWLQGVPPPPSPLGPASDLNTLARMQETCKFWNCKSFRLLLLSFFDLGRWFCASLTFDPPTDPFIVSSPCERRRWSKRMLSLENDTHRCRCRRFLLCHDCRFLPRHFWVWNPCRSRNWPTRGRNWPNSWTRHPEILKLVEVCRYFWAEIVMETRRHLIKGEVHVGFCMYCIYVCMSVCIGLCICHTVLTLRFCV